jgi:hypothetical protein
MASTFGLFLFEPEREPDNFPKAASGRVFRMNNKVVHGKVVNGGKVIKLKQIEALRDKLRGMRSLPNSSSLELYAHLD